jgi:hypothetical protein
VSVKVVWLYSLIRSGSSIVAYSSAAPWDHAVADEPFGPWDRTGEPYNYPKAQDDLQRAFGASAHRLTSRVVELADEVFGTLGRRTGTVIVKIPHDAPTPAQVRQTWPTHRAAFVLRNPLHRLNSLYVRGWLEPSPIGPNFDLEQYRAFARAWLAQPAHLRVTYDMIRQDPHEMYRRLFIAWGFAFTHEHIERATAYARDHYHHASKEITSEHTPTKVVSESRMALPREAVQTYLSDPEMREVFRVAGWTTDPRAYAI